MCLDCEIMPWNAKAMALLTEQYAPVGSAGVAGLEAAIEALHQARAQGPKSTSLSTGPSAVCLSSTRIGMPTVPTAGRRRGSMGSR